MYKSILVILLAGLLAAPALAVPPPVNPYTGEGPGWGQCDTWQDEYGFYQGWGLHNHDGWHLDFGDNFDPGIFDPFCALGSIELWIELYATMSCHNVHWQFHRITDDQVYIYFYVYGYVYSNSLINVEVEGGNLMFQDDKFGDLGDDGGPIMVYYKKKSGSLEDSDPPAGGDQGRLEALYNQFESVVGTPFCIEVGPCDWWWAFIGYACIPYHTVDGYYKLEMTVCPIPWL